VNAARSPHKSIHTATYIGIMGSSTAPKDALLLSQLLLYTTPSYVLFTPGGEGYSFTSVCAWTRMEDTLNITHDTIAPEISAT